MKRYYLTYGLDPTYPYQGGWTTIEAPNRDVACAVFKAFHPSENNHSLNFEDIYTEEEFVETNMNGPNGNLGAHCHELITVHRRVVAPKEKGGPHT